MHKFELGKLVLTSGVLNVMSTLPGPDTIGNLLLRHSNGDWGDICKEDAELNELAIVNSEQILSSYKVGTLNIWVITEWDRSATTILLPEEY